MAKDKKPEKGKGKAAKAEPKKKSGSGKYGAPSEATGGGGDGWKLADTDNVGKLLLITPLREDMQTVKRGKKSEDVKVIVSDIVVLNEKKPEKSELHEEVFVFGKWVQGSIRSYIGEQMVLGRLDQDIEKGQGDRPAWVLLDADADDEKVADAYLASVKPTFAKKADKGKAKKGKKK